MGDPNDVQALELISNEVDESQIKIILSSQCIKAQSFLVNKLRKQSEQRKETCNFIKCGNLKLETEIKNAEQNIKSAITALEIIKSANIELKKEFLLTKERKLEVIERVNTGLKKYEGIWEKSKARYENIPFIKNFLQIKNESLTLRENINILIEEHQKEAIKIKNRKAELENLDRKRILQVAEYFVNEKPTTLLAIKDKTAKINDLKNDIKSLLKNHHLKSCSKLNFNFGANKEASSKISVDVMESSWLHLNRSNTAIGLPKLQLGDFDLDGLSDKLDQFKRDDFLNPIITTKRDTIFTGLDNNSDIKNIKGDEIHMDIKLINDFGNDDSSSKNYSAKKLIHILDDIKLDKLQSYNLVAKVNPEELQDINIIKATTPAAEDNCKFKGNKPSETFEQECIEEIDLTLNSTAGVLVPPTQFLDLTECNEEITLPVESKTQPSLNMDIQETKPGDKNNEASDNLNNVSTASDDSFNKMKDIMLRKHNLDLSPQFVYSKKQSLDVEQGITSKFFDRARSETEYNNNNKVKDTAGSVFIVKEYGRAESKEAPQELFVNVSDSKLNSSSPIAEVNDNMECNKIEVPVAGFLFNHGPSGIPGSLDLSMSTNGYEECDADFPQCIDSSLLLSPKADLPEANENNVQVLSQEVPNFLSGLRKTGFSFFGSTSKPTANEPDTKNNESNFNFNFGGEDKKTRGGLFSMFH